tara:strand:+ start:4532 stop:4714 length:183 start_codon:yes stop_codon:yes gene_type:complete
MLWHILLTICAGSTCLSQDVQWFENKKECEIMLVQYAEIPADGEWDSVEYICKPVGSTGT